MSTFRRFSFALFLPFFPLCVSIAADGPLLDFKLEWRTQKKNVNMIGWDELIPSGVTPPPYYKEVKLTGYGIFDTGWNINSSGYFIGGLGGASKYDSRSVARMVPTGGAGYTISDGQFTFTIGHFWEGFDSEEECISFLRNGDFDVEGQDFAYTATISGPVIFSYTDGDNELAVTTPTTSTLDVDRLDEYQISDPASTVWRYMEVCTLGDQEKERDAEARAEVIELEPNPTYPPVVPPDSNYLRASMREQRVGRNYVRYAAEFRLRLKLCPGEYRLKWRVKGLHKNGTGSPHNMPQSRSILIDENTPLDADGYYDLKYIDIVQQFEGEGGGVSGADGGNEIGKLDYVYRLGTYTDEVTYHFLLEPKDECGCADVGSGGVAFGSVKAWFNLGKDASGKSAGFLRLHAEDIDVAAHLPEALVAVRGDSVTARFEYSAGALRQAQSDRRIIDIVPLANPTEGYQLKFYKAEDATGWEQGRFRTFGTATPELVWTVKRLADAGGFKRIEITRSEGGADFVHVFSQNLATPAIWNFGEANGLRTTTHSESAAPGGDIYRTTTLSDGTYGTASVKRERVRAFAWGEEVIEETLDPSGTNPLTTLFEYYTGGAGQGQLWKTTTPDGVVTENTYAAYDTGLGVITSRIASATVTYPNGRVQTTVHGKLASLTGNPADEAHSLVTTSETFGGQLIRRSWKIGYATAEDLDGDGVSYTTSKTIRAASTTAAWDDGRNEVTVALAADTPAGRVNATLAPDGKITRTANGLPDNEGVRTITTETGPANANGTGLLLGDGGTRTVREIDTLGRTVAQTTTDLGSGLITAFEQVTGWSAMNPELPTNISHIDGDEELRDYSSCCGKLERVTRHGRTTTYTYDALGRQKTSTQDGLTTETRHDAADRVRETLVYPAGSPGAAKLVSGSTYDLAGRLTATTTPHGHGQTVATTMFETVNATTGATTTVTTYPSDTNLVAGVVTEVRAADGSALRVTGNATAPVAYAYAAVVLPDASTWGFASGDRFFATTETRLDGDGNATAETVTTHQDALGRTIKTVYADGATARNFHDPAGRLSKAVDPDGVTTLYAYASGSSGDKTTVAVDLAATTGGARNGTIDHAGGHDRVTETTATVAQRDGVTVRRIKTEIWETGSSATTVGLVETAVDGLKSWQTARGAQTTATVVVIGAAGARTETTTDPDGTSLVRVFENGRLAGETRTDAAGTDVSAVAYAYDDYGRLERETRTGVGTTTFGYFDDGQVESLATPDPGTGAQTTGYTYNKRGWVASITHPDAAVKETSYHPDGRIKREWGARTYPVDYTYDAQGRMKTLTTWRDFAGTTGAAVTTWNYHAQRGWLENKRHHDNQGPSYTYTPAGRLQTRTWARGSSLPAPGSPLVTTYSYTDAGDIEGIDYSDATPDVVHTYDRAGRPKTTADAAGLLTRSYDPVGGALSGEAYSGSGILSGRSLARTYDNRHRPQTLATDGGYGVSYGYDEAGRLGTVGHGFHQATYRYKPGHGVVESIAVKRVGVERVKHTRQTDSIGRITRVQSASAATLHVQRDYGYNDANQRTGVEQEDTRRWAYGYDDLGQVTSAQKRLADNVTPLPGYTFGYTFDDIGNRLQTVTNGRATTYTPDALNRYSSRQVAGALDVRGEADPSATVTVNSLATTRTGRDFYREIASANTSAATNTNLTIQAVLGGDTVTETRNGFLPLTPEAYAHDLDGNLTQDGRWDYTWDAENRLVAMETRASIATAFPALKQRLEFAYDAQGRRIRKVVKAWDGAASGGAGAWVTTADLRFVYDAWNLLTELDANNAHAMVRSHVWGLDLSGTPQGAGGVGGLLWTNTPTHSFAACADANGNIVAWINTATLAVSGRADYGAFGERVQQTGVATTLPFGFSSKYTDPETGFAYYGLRYYNPSTGRWLSRDPIEERGGLNLYGMLSNDPLNRNDNMGLNAGANLLGLVCSYHIETQDGQRYRGNSNLVSINNHLIDDLVRDLQAIKGAGKKLKRLSLTGHGGNVELGPLFNIGNLLNDRLGIENSLAEPGVNHVQIPGGIFFVNNGSELLAGSHKITDLMRAILSDESVIDLNACNSARMSSNIAKDLANLFPGVQVNGYAGYAVNLGAFGVPATFGFGATERTTSMNVQSDISTPQERQEVVDRARAFLSGREALINSVTVEVEVRNPFESR